MRGLTFSLIASLGICIVTPAYAAPTQAPKTTVTNATVEGQLDKGRQAYKSHNYELALSVFKPLAEQNNATAQYFLGNHYQYGRAVPVDYTMAAYWYQRAAEQDHTDAQAT